MPVSSSPHGIGKIVQKINEEYNNYSSTVRNDFVNNIVNEINNTNYVISGSNVDVSTQEYFANYAPPDLFTAGNLSNTLSNGVGTVISQDNYLYLTDDAGMVVAFIWDSHAPEGQTQPTNTFSGGGWVGLLDPTTLVRVGENGTESGFVETYDITKPRQISRIGSLTGGAWFDGLDSTQKVTDPAIFANNYVYFCDNGGSNTKVVDVSDRANPTVSDLPAETNYSRTHAIKDGYLLISVQDGVDKWWYVYDVSSDPVNPPEVAQVSSTHRYQNGIVVGDYLYANGDGNDSSNLGVVDVSDPTNPSQVAGKTGSSGTMYYSEITSNGSLLYRMGASGALDVWDIFTNPADPTLIHAEAPATGYGNGGTFTEDGFMYRLNGSTGELGTFG